MSAAIPSMTGIVRSARKMPPIAERVADRLAQAVPRRDLEIAERRRVHADLHHVDHVVRPLERGAPVEGGGDRRRGADGGVRPACDCLGHLQPLGVDVVERDFHIRELGEGENVTEQVLRELDTAGAHERYPGTHERKCFIADITEQECSQLPKRAPSNS